MATTTPPDRVWGEYDRYGYRVLKFVADDVPEGYAEEHGEYGEQEIYRAGNSPYDSASVLRGDELKHAVPLAKLAAYCRQTAEQEAEDLGLPFAGVSEVNEDDPDEEEDDDE